MKNSINRTRLIVLAIALAMAGLAPTRLAAEPSPDLMNSILQSREEAVSVPKGETVAMVCAKCRTVLLSKEETEKGFLGWFQPKTKHECPGCGGKFSMKEVYAGQGGTKTAFDYVHTCSKCGDDSAFCCSTKPGASPTGGMEKK